MLSNIKLGNIDLFMFQEQSKTINVIPIHRKGYVQMYVCNVYKNVILFSWKLLSITIQHPRSLNIKCCINVFDVIYVLIFSLPEDQYFYFICVVYYYVALLLNEFFFRYILCPAMYRKLSKGGSENDNARCSTTRGKIT